MAQDHFMTRALELARRAPSTSPNPRVGAVLVRDGRVLGEGWHQGPGEPHAEIVALQGADARGATLYVTLEPCIHHGRTPPCAPEVVAAGVSRVEVAMEDPDPQVAGRGIGYLAANGVDVAVGAGELEARRLTDAYAWHRTTGRPLVTVKLALTLDGRLAAADGTSQWITGPSTRRLVHEKRARADAVMVGAGTVLADDPRLTARGVQVARQPLRVLVDAVGRIPPDARALAGRGDVVVATTARASHDVQTAWKEAGAELLVLPEVAGRVDLRELMGMLGRRGVLAVQCEGGAALAGALVREGLADRLDLNYVPLLVGGGHSLDDLGVSSLADASRWVTRSTTTSGDDILVELESPALAALLGPRTGRRDVHRHS